MRIWSIHPKYLDAKGLVALWRETLLARKVLEGQTSGYRNHPQLIRFKEVNKSVDFLDCYLKVVWKEANARGYAFSKEKFRDIDCDEKILVTRGQVEYEAEHLKRKLEKRCPECLGKVDFENTLHCHPVFQLIEGGIESWEKTF